VTALVWDGCINVRDLGGLPTADGEVTQFGRVVRADNLRRLSERGRQALVDHGVARVVDLRFPEELAEDPAGDLPVEVVHVSLLGARRTREWQDEQNAAMDVAATADEYLVQSYSDFLDRYRDRFAAAVQAIADAPPGAVVVHCMGGKDRTGLITALVLRLVGVDAEVVGADYALTEEALAPTAGEWIAAAPDEAERRRRVLLQPAPAAAMTAVVARLDERYGSVRDYLRGAGVTDDALERVRERLLAPA
jgi:protein tyrosine/serine phosphatase